jgi:hypothetical protein
MAVWIGGLRASGEFRRECRPEKSKSWIVLPKPNAELIAVRLRRARELDRED